VIITILSALALVALICFSFVDASLENKSSHRVVERNKIYYVQKKNDFSIWEDMIKSTMRSMGEMHIEYYSFTDKKSAIQCAKKFAEKDKLNPRKAKEKIIDYF